MSPQAVRLLVASTLLLTTGCAAIDRMTGMEQARDLARRGEPARARILEIWDTDVTLNQDRAVGERPGVIGDDIAADRPLGRGPQGER